MGRIAPIIVATGRGADKMDGYGPYRAVPAELRVDGTAVAVNEVGEQPSTGWTTPCRRSAACHI
jgi:hypothetical protein